MSTYHKRAYTFSGNMKLFLFFINWLLIHQNTPYDCYALKIFHSGFKTYIDEYLCSIYLDMLTLSTESFVLK